MFSQRQTMIKEKIKGCMRAKLLSYKDLLNAFEDAGIELRDEIDSYFERFK